MKNLIVAFLLSASAVSAQTPTTKVSTTVRDTIVNGVNSTITIETTENFLPPYDTTQKTTIAEKSKPESDKTPETTKVIRTTVVTTTDKPVPIRETNYNKFRTATIYLLKSEVKDNQFQFTYFNRCNDNALTSYVTPIGSDEVVNHLQAVYVFKKNAPLSVLAIPFKIRPMIDGRPAEAKSNANLGLSVPLIGLLWNRLFADGGKSAHLFSLNAFAAPALEKIDSTNTNGRILIPRDNIVLSTGLSLTYTYNNEISFSIIPLATDIGFTSATDQWVYDRKYWWGFGIGVSPVVLWRAFD